MRFRFQGQTELHGSKPSDLRAAIEEAFLAEHGFLEVQFDGMSSSGELPYFTRTKEAASLYHEQECQSDTKASVIILACSTEIPLLSCRFLDNFSSKDKKL